ASDAARKAALLRGVGGIQSSRDMEKVRSSLVRTLAQMRAMREATRAAWHASANSTGKMAEVVEPLGLRSSKSELSGTCEHLDEGWRPSAGPPAGRSGPCVNKKVGKIPGRTGCARGAVCAYGVRFGGDDARSDSYSRPFGYARREGRGCPYARIFQGAS